MSLNLNDRLLGILNRIFPPEQPTETELLSYVRETAPVEKRIVYLLELICQQHGTALIETAPGEWKCSTPHEIPSVSRQNEPEVAQVYKTYTQDIQPRYASFSALQRHNSQMAQVKITALRDEAPDTVVLPSMPRLTPAPRQVLPNQTGPNFEQDSFLSEAPADDLRDDTQRYTAIHILQRMVG